jgi:hypothetical protein
VAAAKSWQRLAYLRSTPQVLPGCGTPKQTLWPAMDLSVVVWGRYGLSLLGVFVVVWLLRVPAVT